MKTLDRKPTYEELQRVRIWECSQIGCKWEIINEMGSGPVAIVCSNCGDEKEVLNG